MSIQYFTGPCIVRRGGVSIYWEAGLKRNLQTATEDVKSDLHGKISEFMKSRKIVISGKPVDMLANLAAIFALTIANIGESIFKGSPRTIASVSVANPGVVTVTAGHNLGGVGTTIEVTIAGTTTTPSINGTKVATVLSPTTFSVPVAVTNVAVGTGTVTPVSEPLQIVSKNDNMIYTYERAGITKVPGLHMGASKGIFNGDLEFTVLGSVSKEQTDADYWKTAVAAAFSDLKFDQSKFKRYRYTAAWGEEAAPYDAMRGQEGFDVMINYATEEITDDFAGVGDIILTSVDAEVKFVPMLSEPEVDVLTALQDTDALLPGQDIAKEGDKDLVISGADGTGGFTFTLYGVGFKDSSLMYQTGKLRTGEVAGVTRRTWAAGVANPLYAMVIV